MKRTRTENFFNELLASRSMELFSLPKYWAEDMDFALENFLRASSVSWICGINARECKYKQFN